MVGKEMQGCCCCERRIRHRAMDEVVGAEQGGGAIRPAQSDEYPGRTVQITLYPYPSVGALDLGCPLRARSMPVTTDYLPY